MTMKTNATQRLNVAKLVPHKEILVKTTKVDVVGSSIAIDAIVGDP